MGSITAEDWGERADNDNTPYALLSLAVLELLVWCTALLITLFLLLGLSGAGHRGVLPWAWGEGGGGEFTTWCCFGCTLALLLALTFPPLKRACLLVIGCIDSALLGAGIDAEDDFLEGVGDGEGRAPVCTACTPTAIASVMREEMAVLLICVLRKLTL